MARHEQSSQRTCTRRWDEPSTSTSKRTRRLRSSSRTGVGKTRHIQVRWLWIQDAIRDKVVRLRKVKGTDNDADVGIKDLDGPTHQRLLRKLPLKPTQCRRLLGLIETANVGSVVEAQMNGNEETLGKFSFSTSDDCDTDSIGEVGPDGCTTSRRDISKQQLWERLLSEAHRLSSILSIRSRFRQTCTVLREVNATTCRWILLGGDVRVCIAYSETDNEVENIVKDALENNKVVALGPVICSS